MSRLFLAFAAAALVGLSGAQAPAVAKGAKPDPAQCFRTGRMSNWASDGDRLINVKLQTGAVFQVTLVGACPGLGTYRTLAFDSGFNDMLCNGRPATVVTRSGAGPLHCAVQSVRALTPEQAAALPDAQRP
jgi:hypothetical protein